MISEDMRSNEIDQVFNKLINTITPKYNKDNLPGKLPQKIEETLHKQFASHLKNEYDMAAANLHDLIKLQHEISLFIASKITKNMQSIGLIGLVCKWRIWDFAWVLLKISAILVTRDLFDYNVKRVIEYKSMDYQVDYSLQNINISTIINVVTSKPAYSRNIVGFDYDDSI
jgi:hypothetical protein